MAETRKTQFVSSEPEHLAISKSKGIKIDWKDGHTSEYGLSYLRHHCPCAVCSGSHGTPPQAPPIEPSPFQMYTPPQAPPIEPSPFHMYQAPLKMVAIETVGNFAIRILWSDGHGSGIYSFGH